MYGDYEAGEMLFKINPDGIDVVSCVERKNREIARLIKDKNIDCSKSEKYLTMYPDLECFRYLLPGLPFHEDVYQHALDFHKYDFILFLMVNNIASCFTKYEDVPPIHRILNIRDVKDRSKCYYVTEDKKQCTCNKARHNLCENHHLELYEL